MAARVGMGRGSALDRDPGDGSVTAVDWRDEAACRGDDASLWFPVAVAVEVNAKARARLEAPAKAVCAACPVRSACLAHAVATGEHHGIWGGLNPVERQLGVPVPDGVTQRQLAARLGVNQRTVQGWLSGRAQIPAAHTDALRAALIEAAS